MALNFKGVETILFGFGEKIGSIFSLGKIEDEVTSSPRK